jgi:hypothetical protein
VVDRALACTYCGADLNVIGENLGSLILSNVEAVKAALAQDKHLGLQGRHLEPVTFKDLNREYFMPLFEHTDRGVVLGRLVEGAGEPPELLIDYQVLFSGEDPARIKVDWIKKVVFTGGVHQWFGGWRRCPSCSGRYHISRVVRSERELRDADDCPLCATRELAKQLELVKQAAQSRLSAALRAVPEKPGWLAGDIERKRHRDARTEVAESEALADEWSDPDLSTLLDDVAALAQTPLVGRDAASDRHQMMHDLGQLTVRLGDQLRCDDDAEESDADTTAVSPQVSHSRNDVGSIAQEPDTVEGRWVPGSLAGILAAAGFAALFVWSVASAVGPEIPRKSQSGSSTATANTLGTTTTKPSGTAATATSKTALLGGPTFEPVIKSGRGPAVFALPSRDASSVITATHAASSPFTLSVVNGKGRHIAKLVERSDPYTGTTFVEPGRDYPFFLKVDTRDDWTINITPDTELAVLDRSTSGNGDAVLYSPGHPGNWTFTYSGKADFRVRLVDDSDGVLVSSTGPFKKTAFVPSGRGVLLLKAHGPWSIRLP